MNNSRSTCNPAHHQQSMLAFKGSMSFDLVNTLLGTFEAKLHDTERDIPTRKRLYHILVECLQNIVHHGADVGSDDVGLRDRAAVLVTLEKDTYNVQTCNIIRSSHVGHVRRMLESVVDRSPDELRKSYKQALVNGKLSGRGTAGLGFIDIARRSGQKPDYEFKRVNERYSVFCLNICVQKRVIS